MPDYMRLMAWAIGEVLKAALCDVDSLDSAACSSDDSEGRGEFSEGALDGEEDLFDKGKKRALVEVEVDMAVILVLSWKSLLDLTVAMFNF
ncbi:hypothetical protein CPC16_000769 [Podila verticillata]|nr:hypothetical protein CPC16_000769 [Podila verticillata]KFH67529.1 hypothetical protein MVEG_06261 [Podila verticillata NRRL 6337]